MIPRGLRPKFEVRRGREKAVLPKAETGFAKMFSGIVSGEKFSKVRSWCTSHIAMGYKPELTSNSLSDLQKSS